MKKNIIWFRNDLRINDNPALYHAYKNSINTRCIGIFFMAINQWKKYFIPSIKIKFIHRNVLYLRKKLYVINIPLLIINNMDYISSVNYLVKFSIQENISCVYYNKEYELDEINRDNYADHQLLKNNISVKNFHGNSLYDPSLIHSQKGKSYKKFYFFKKLILKKIKKYKIKYISFLPKRYKKKKLIYIENLIYKKNKNNFIVGEEYALRKLKLFCKKKIKKYGINRNFPSVYGTSFLSVYLSLGIITVKQCLFYVLKKNKNNIDVKNKFFPWINELLWREFYKYLVFHNPILSKGYTFSILEKKITWENNSYYFQSWKNGLTGYPIIDAGMRQLNNTGWMHNRLRMITASFLVKNLLVDWRKGELYFISKLMDGDYASNNGGWQWVSSFGVDHMPYFRFFNPILQSKKFDKYGLFIKRYIPELRSVPNLYIHNPHKWINKNKININYPNPIVDLHISKQKFLEIFKKINKDNKK
ncbi:FAD-binding domain-containing protein [Buchnera aphidicola (Kurisakia onigurumii)]|uniref:cryptochrome/photolyase family protein n=1 Tax=Buchnera aphidicola TaxID=9 RepID=UPI0031B6D4ED